ncbi:MAG TPA: hypothetical protein VMA13_09790 [Candidatus Saccharimonadales bacterium]|nr:hypothetical protein [Candidatus Saccharimonadales bacterium]
MERQDNAFFWQSLFQLRRLHSGCYDAIAGGDSEKDGWQFHPFQYFCFAVPGLEGTLISYRKAGDTTDKGIKTMSWGEQIFYGRDPFGCCFSFVDERTVFKSRESDYTTQQRTCDNSRYPLGFVLSS